jgi:hypothetical protein
MQHDFPKATHTPRTILDFYLFLPSQYFEFGYRAKPDVVVQERVKYLKMQPANILDVKNGYLLMYGDGAQFSMSMAIFRRTDNSYLVTVVQGGEETQYGKAIYSDIDCYLYNPQKRQLYAVPQDEFGIPRGAVSFNLPHYGRTIHVQSYRNKKPLYDLFWDGKRFIKQH